MQGDWYLLVIDRFDRAPEIWQKAAWLAGLSAGVTVTSDPEVAEPLLLRGGFDLVFCSYYFPAETGTQFFTRMREKGVQTPVIFIATEMDTKGVLEAAAMPMADFLVTPFAAENLKRHINLLLGTTDAPPPQEPAAQT